MAKRQTDRPQLTKIYTFQSPSNRCDGCGKPAEFIVHGQPHCKDHMLEALCGVPTAVIRIDGGYNDAS